ncbi:O-antigen ligase [Austwickia chelonae]|uniref:O-antigen ligase-related domain-containing protein n=1 Tax=Austwickia chelonae NBRC 105200 TaxID=1184607 RepID=K6UMI5_9MICO|nr:O-antigen ligase family protein [Austwickia chelonae]GAB78146.1 hypothetical protein AUCHE_08_03910 [Austwickia chelonae NBRC 105200]SEV97598.1 O-antigen ligase [Austwickia chelonae]
MISRNATPSDDGTGLTGKIMNRYPIAQKALIAVPLLAFAGPFASVVPGASGFPYFYRILWAVGLIIAVPLFLMEVRRRTLPMAYSVMVLCWTVWAPLTLMWSPAPSTGRTEILAGTMAMWGSWVVLVLTRGSSRSVRLLRHGWVLAFVVTMLFVIWEFFTGRHLGEVTGVQEWTYSVYSVAGLDTNPNGLSNFMVAVVAVLCAQLVREVGGHRPHRNRIDAAENDIAAPPPVAANTRTWRIVAIFGCLLLAGFTVYLTGSRAGALALMMLFVATAIWCLPTRRFLVPVALIVLTVGMPLLQDSDLNRVRPERVTDQASRPNKSGRYQDNISADKKQADVASADKLRLNLTALGLRYVSENPVHGAGAGAALTLVAQDPDYQPGVPAAKKHVLNLHNTYLEIAVNYGLIGLLPIVAVILLSLQRLLRIRPLRQWWPDPLVFEGLGILLALAVTSVITSSSIGTPTFWLLGAYAAALAWNYEHVTRQADAASEAAPAVLAHPEPTER